MRVSVGITGRAGDLVGDFVSEELIVSVVEVHACSLDALGEIEVFVAFGVGPAVVQAVQEGVVGGSFETVDGFRVIVFKVEAHRSIIIMVVRTAVTHYKYQSINGSVEV